MGIFDPQVITPTVLQPSVGNQLQAAIFQALLTTAGYGPSQTATQNPDGSFSVNLQTLENQPHVDISKTLIPEVAKQWQQGGMPSSFTPAPLAKLQNDTAGKDAMTSMVNTGYASDQLKKTAENYLAPFLHPAASGTPGANPMAYHAPMVGAPPVQSMFNRQLPPPVQGA